MKQGIGDSVNEESYSREKCLGFMIEKEEFEGPTSTFLTHGLNAASILFLCRSQIRIDSTGSAPRVTTLRKLRRGRCVSWARK